MNKIALIDSGLEHIHLSIYGKTKVGNLDELLCDQVIKNTGNLRDSLNHFDILEKLSKVEKVYITGKLAEITKIVLTKGEIIIPAAAIWSAAKFLLKRQKEEKVNSLGIIDISASGYMLACVDKNGNLKQDLLITNSRCGAGSGLNLNRVLEKLGLAMDQVDELLQEYLGSKATQKRKDILVRADRCGVFSSSATISDKNQGIPVTSALAVTMKSEILKACQKMLSDVDEVWLTGRVFKWQFARDCVVDYLKENGVKEVVYDKTQSILLQGIKRKQSPAS